MKVAFISELSSSQLRDYLNEQGYHVIDICETNSVYKSIAAHPDIYLCKLGERVVVANEQLHLLKAKLDQYHINYISGSSVLNEKYPHTIYYNALEIGHYFVHQIKHTDEQIMKIVQKMKYKTISVKQGYTKCNICFVDENSIITSDKGIAKELKKYGIDVLLIESGHVELDGFDYGFIGGASGKIGDTILFNGDIKKHPNYKEIKSFIQQKGLKCDCIPDYPLKDIGSIITYEHI